MIRISLCMIVKNEEKILKRCLDSVADLMDELIIVDTGSTDRTKEIAASYPGAKIYDFTWIGDFAAARNFAFSKATGDYIYSADADEVLDEENRERFRILKEAMLPEIEIVQMKYANQLSFGTVYNFDEEYRPKLFKRVRNFIWEGAVHETILTTPVIYDSDIVILHMPENMHASRDFEIFEKLYKKGEGISKRLRTMYAKELFIAGEDEDFLRAGDCFLEAAVNPAGDAEEVKEANLVVAAASRIAGKTEDFFKYAMKVVADNACSEICCELGDFYYEKGDFEEAVIWYYNAHYETEPMLCVRMAEREPLEKLICCYEKLGNFEEALLYRQELERI